MTSPHNPRGFDWESAGRDVGARLDAYHSLVVVGVDPVATGRVAMGLARTQAANRRVAVGDLFAESPPIQEYVPTDDPHGLVDCFLYGVSLTRIAYPVPDAGQLFVMPSGSEPPDYEEMLPNPRWHRLAAGFQEVNALLMLAVPASAPRIESLVAATDGVILVGESVPAALPAARVVASVREPAEMRAAREAHRRREVEGGTVIEPPPRPRRQPRWIRPRPRFAATAGVVLTAALVAIAAWLAYRPLADSHNGAIIHRGDTAHDSLSVIAADPAPPASGTDSSGESAAVIPSGQPAIPAVTNPGDSADASAYAVDLMAANTQAAVILMLQQNGKNLPAATFSPDTIQNARWFKVTTGAYPERRQADSLLADLRQRRMLVSGEHVVRLPFAFLIDSGRPPSAVGPMLSAYADRGLPVYALRQADGTAWLLLGAFASPEQAALNIESLRASGIDPVLVYRKGRPF